MKFYLALNEYCIVKSVRMCYTIQKAAENAVIYRAA